MIPLFDALAHPTVTGKWLGRPNSDASFASLTTSMNSADFTGACAVGMAGHDGYEHATFIKKCQPYPQLVPIAGFNPFVDDLVYELDLIAKLGFRGIKLHPRFSSIDLARDEARMAQVLQGAAERNLVVFLCTYHHAPLASYPDHDPLYAMVRVLKQAPEAKVVLVHGGDVRLLEYAELVRHNPNLLLDLSLTLMKYRGSAIDNSIQFLFQLFDRRICIGTDHPEYSHQAVRARFEHFSAELPSAKRHNIAHRNIIAFLGLA